MALDRVRDAEGVPLWAHFDVKGEQTGRDLFAVFLESRKIAQTLTSLGADRFDLKYGIRDVSRGGDDGHPAVRD